MTWIRGPVYDCAWILSAPLLGLATVFAPSPIGLLLMFNFAHSVSPIILAWTHDGYRHVMLAKPRKFIGVPILLMMTGITVAVVTSALYPDFVPRRMSLENLTWEKMDVPIVIWANIYAVWNLYHGGAQDFGIWCLYRRSGFKGWQKYLALGAVITVFVLLSHELTYWWGSRTYALFILGFVSANHWLAAIGLCGHVHGRHTGQSPIWFISLVLLVGLAYSEAFLYAVRSQPILWIGVLVFSTRGSVGIWHFLQDRWIWQLSKPEVRATIGKDLFSHA